jgi:hypothetical protein
MTTVVGTLAGLALVAAFFLPWVRMPQEVAARYRARIHASLSDPVRPPPSNADDWRRLADLVAERGAVTGLDVFYWARTAHATAGELQDGEESRTSRGILLAAILVIGVPILSLLLVLHFLVHRLRRARSPALILAMLTGAAAVGIASVYGIVAGVVDRETDGAIGLTILLVGGFALFLAGAFGVRLRNWWRVFGGTLVVGAALAFLGYVWLRWGVSP